MTGIRLLRMGDFQSPLMNNCRDGIGISIFLLDLMEMNRSDITVKVAESVQLAQLN